MSETQVQRTATAMLTVLGEAGEGTPVLTSDLRHGIAALGAQPRYVPDAAKVLRNMGVHVVATKQRHLSDWRLYSATPDEISDTNWTDRVVREHYSEFVSMARSMYHAAQDNSTIQDVREQVVRTCIDLGCNLGKPMAVVIAECDPTVMTAP